MFVIGENEMLQSERNNLGNAMTDLEHTIVALKNEVIAGLQGMDYEFHPFLLEELQNLKNISAAHKLVRKVFDKEMRNVCSRVK